MTNKAANRAIERSERAARGSIKIEAKVYGAFALLTLVVSATCALFAGFESWNLVASYAITAIFGSFTAVALGMMSLYKYGLSRRRTRHFETWKTLLLWRQVHRSKTFGSPIWGTALHIRELIDQIYSTRAGESLLPLSQAIRLFDVCVKQQKQLKPLSASLTRLYMLRDPFTTKTAQLTALGQTRTKSPEEQRLDDEIYWAETAHSQVESSCYRLEKIVEDVHREAQARQLHNELDELSERLPQQSASIEPAFEAESLEEIERQIGREIETYLRLERETDEQLR